MWKNSYFFCWKLFKSNNANYRKRSRWVRCSRRAPPSWRLTETRCAVSAPTTGSPSPWSTLRWQRSLPTPTSSLPSSEGFSPLHSENVKGSRVVLAPDVVSGRDFDTYIPVFLYRSIFILRWVVQGWIGSDEVRKMPIVIKKCFQAFRMTSEDFLQFFLT